MAKADVQTESNSCIANGRFEAKRKTMVGVALLVKPRLVEATKSAQAVMPGK
jgi:hypothetical protein